MNIQEPTSGQTHVLMVRARPDTLIDGQRVNDIARISIKPVPTVILHLSQQLPMSLGETACITIPTSSTYLGITWHMRIFMTTMASRARQFAPLKEGASASAHLPRLKVGEILLLLYIPIAFPLILTLVGFRVGGSF